MTDTVLIVPGRDRSPAHWQSLWQLRHPDYVRTAPEDLDRAIREAQGSVFIVAHDVGCVVLIRRLAGRWADVAGALLVAPTEPDFPFGEIPIPTTLVASCTDRHMPLRKAHSLARQLGGRFVNAGDAGHIDAESGHGPWPEGERLLAKLIQRSRTRERELLVGLSLCT